MHNETLKHLQETELRILRAFKHVCEKNELQYFLTYGTLLGAVRHKGFIPWDDDIDVMMPMNDYLKFIEIGQKELGDSFFLQTHKTDPNYYAPFAKIRLNNTTLKLSTYSKWHIHSGIDIDIFPIVNISESEVKKKSKILKICAALQMQDFLKHYPNEFNEKYRSSYVRLLKLMYVVTPLKLRIAIYDTLLKRHFLVDNECEYCAILLGTNIHRLFPRGVFSDSVMTDFCDEKYKIPKGYDRFLEICYGDYMELPPESERHTCHGDIIDFEKSI